jgi:putative membrane protein
MKVFARIGYIACIEARFLMHYRRLLLSTVVVVLVPALYSLIYLGSVWDPEGHSTALPVALVNLDDGVQYKEHAFNIGGEITTQLQNKGHFGFVRYEDEQVARALVRQGAMAFALIIPRDFSANALPGTMAGAGKVMIYTSEGNNFESAAIAKHFAESLGREVNDSLNERRWALVLQNATGSQRSVQGLRDGVQQLRSGAAELSTGTLSTRTGAQGLASGANKLSDGADQLQKGSTRLLETATAFRDDAKDSLFVSSKSVEALDQFVAGLTQLDTGTQAASTAQDKLTDGAIRVNTSVETLTTGVRTMGNAVHAMASRLPDDTRLDEVSKGATDVAKASTLLVDATAKLHHGVQRLAGGIDLLANALPNNIEPMDGSAQGLASSVLPVVEVSAPVQNSGSGFAANVIPGALWLGAGVAVFLIRARVLPRQARKFSRLAQVLGKAFLPACVALLQTAVVFSTALFVLEIHVSNPWALALTLVVTSMTFLFIVFALTKALGDAGKGIAMFLLALQLSSSGGIVPVELSGGLFAQLSPWLPMTWVVKSVKASMFGAYGGDCLTPLALVACAGIVAVAIACWWGRPRYARAHMVRSVIEF